MKLITISGLDGSGKSTQVEMTKEYLEKQRKKIFYFHAVSFSIANKILKPKNKGLSPHYGDLVPFVDTTPKAVTSSGNIKIFFRKIALIIDAIRFQKLYNTLAKTHDYILSDRYFYDQIVNILYLESKNPFNPPFPKGENRKDIPLNKGGLRGFWWQKIAEKYIIKPDVAIYLQASPEEIIKRERTIEQGIGYLETKKKLYDNLYKKWELILIDGNDTKETINNKITKIFLF